MSKFERFAVKALAVLGFFAVLAFNANDNLNPCHAGQVGAGGMCVPVVVTQ